MSTILALKIPNAASMTGVTVVKAILQRVQPHTDEHYVV